jgi:glycosyltransferase involved in cell wall biosynthesis
MPVYNAGRYLTEAVQSILDQTFCDFEFIIINDGSTDDSPELLRTFAAMDARIVLVDRPNGGYSSALNEAFKLAKGEFVARMDADDISLTTRFAQQTDYLRRHQDYAAVGTNAIVVDCDGDPVTLRCCPTDHAAIDGDHLRGIGGQLIHPSAMIRRKAMKAIGAYRTEFEPAEDMDLFLRLAEVGKLANLPQFLLKYRLHDKNASVTRTSQQYKNSMLAVVEARRRRGLPLTWTNDGPVQCTVELPEKDHKKYFVRAAIESGFHKTARKHAWKVWRQQPTSFSSWSLLFRSLTGMKAATALRLFQLARPRAQRRVAL